MPSSRIVELAAIIQKHTSKVDEYLTSHDLPSPSFDISTPPVLQLPPHIQASQKAIIEADDELSALILGPMRSIDSTPFNAWVSIQAIQRFSPASSFPPGSTSTFAAIASAASLPESDVTRILRHAMTFRIFAEPSNGVVTHTAASKALASMPLLQDLVAFLSHEMWPSASRLVDTMEKWPGSQQPNESGFALACATDMPMFDVVGRDPERARRMAGAMTLMHTGPGYSVKHLLENFEWGEAARGVLVDVGGGKGTVGTEIARYLREMKCIVQDLHQVVEGVEVPEDLKVGRKIELYGA